MGKRDKLSSTAAAGRQQGRDRMAQQSDDLAILASAFEDALTDLLLEVSMEGGTSFDRQMKLRLARNRLRRHKDFTEKGVPS
jgi:hypothetical protein